MYLNNIDKLINLQINIYETFIICITIYIKVR